jgi:hypothetical protein
MDLVSMILSAVDHHKVAWRTDKPNGQMRRPTNKDVFNEFLPNFEYTDLKEAIQRTVNWFITTYPNVRL